MPAKKKRILVVTADGGSARFFETARLGGALTELEDRRLSAPPMPAVEKPFRVHDRLGPSRHAIEAHETPRAAHEARFLKAVAKSIDDGLDHFDEVVLCAPPRALGLLRDDLSKAVRDRLRLEIAKDYVRENRRELSALLAEAAP